MKSGNHILLKRERLWLVGSSPTRGTINIQGNNMTDLLKYIRDMYVAGSKRVPSFTKKGPGRKHKQGKKNV